MSDIVRVELYKMAHLAHPICPMCGGIINLGKMLPRECALLAVTSAFQNKEEWDLYSSSGMCPDCQHNWFGKED